MSLSRVNFKINSSYLWEINWVKGNFERLHFNCTSFTVQQFFRVIYKDITPNQKFILWLFNQSKTRSCCNFLLRSICVRHIRAIISSFQHNIPSITGSNHQLIMILRVTTHQLWSSWHGRHSGFHNYHLNTFLQPKLFAFNQARN
jgi:hypothetical protein